jgi:hypothetical protein
MSRSIEQVEMDRLRLVALGRIPRCGVCPRYRALRAAHRSGSRAMTPMPPVPESCTHEVCAPIAARYRAVRHAGADWPTAVGQS